MKPNLSHKIGLCISHRPLEPIDWWLAAGMRHFRIGIEWAVFNPKPGEYHFDQATPAFRKIADAGGKLLVHLFMVPSFLRNKAWPADFEYPRVLGHPFAIPIFREEWVIEWVDYVRRFLDWAKQFGDAIEVCGPIVETNLPGWWEKERTPEEVAAGKQKQERSPEDFIALVIRPVAPMIRFAGKKVIAGTVSLQGERSWTFNRAAKYFDHYKSRHFGSIDHLDLHVYREVGSQTVDDIKRVFKHFETLGREAYVRAKRRGATEVEARQEYLGKTIKNPIWISELGFNEKGGFTWWEELWNNIRGRDIPGEQRQELKYKQLFRFLESTKPEDRVILDKIKRIYFYRGHAGDEDASADELLNPPTETNPQWTPKKAAMLIREYLQAA